MYFVKMESKPHITVWIWIHGGKFGSVFHWEKLEEYGKLYIVNPRTTQRLGELTFPPPLQLAVKNPRIPFDSPKTLLTAYC